MEGRKATPESSVQDRRAERRSPHSLNIRYTREGSTGVSRGTLVDLNTRGAGIQTDQPLIVGGRLILEIASPSGSTARCAAEILHTRRSSTGVYQTGAKFIDLDEQDMEALGQILRIDVPPDPESLAEDDTPPPDSLSRIHSGLERRRAARFAVNRSISYKIYEPGGHVAELGVAQIFDLSLTGVGLRTSGPVRQGISIQLEVIYSGGLRCAIEAESVYCRKDGENKYTNGLRFTAIERSDLVFFSQLLAG